MSLTSSEGLGFARARERYLLPETMVDEDGLGPTVETESKPVTLTLGITTALEQEDLDVTVWGSPDGEHWGERPIAKFRRKSYCGLYRLPLDLSRLPQIKHLRVKWHMSRWGVDRGHPMFGFFVAMA